MTVTSASAQKKGQWLSLDAQLFSRQLENNTVKAHGIHAAGLEALLTGISGEDVQAEGKRLEEKGSAGSPLHLNCPLPYAAQ